MIVAAETTDMLLCLLADTHYAFPMSAVREVIRWRTATPIPGTPPTIFGVIHHRGAVLPIVDVRPLLGLAVLAPTRSTRLVVIAQDEIQAAIVSDAVADILALDSAAIEPPPTSLPAIQAQYMTGIVFDQDRPVALLNPATLFAAITATQHG